MTDPAIALSGVTFAWPDTNSEPVFADLDLDLSPGLVFFVGPNGIGKSTLMLLAAARLFPQAGGIEICGVPTTRYKDAALDPDLEEERNRLASIVYQNMEFETEDQIGTLLTLVAESGAAPERAESQRSAIVSAAGLGDRLSARMQELSKGEMQRAIVALSVLYGSPVVMLDEPVFAVEPGRADTLFAYLSEIAGTDRAIYASVHDVELARRYADRVVLFGEDGTITTGMPDELLSRNRLEEAFRAPYDTLYERQRLYRGVLKDSYS